MPLFVKIPAFSDKWIEVTKEFEEHWNYPYAFGAICGKHVTIKRSKN